MSETRAFTTAGGGTALTSTAVLLPLPRNTKSIRLTPRNFVTAVVARYFRNPYLIVLETRDAAATFIDHSEVVQDFTSTAVATLSSLGTLANGDALYIGSHEAFRGARVDGTLFNGTASDLAVHYWTADGWIAVTTLSDGSASGGATFGQDGNVTWDVPTLGDNGWRTARLADILSVPVTRNGNLGTRLFWTRWTVSVALDTTVTLANLLALNRSTLYDEIVPGQGLGGLTEWGPGGYGCIEALTDAGTCSLVGIAETDGRF